MGRATSIGQPEDLIDVIHQPDPAHQKLFIPCILCLFSETYSLALFGNQTWLVLNSQRVITHLITIQVLLNARFPLVKAPSFGDQSQTYNIPFDQPQFDSLMLMGEIPCFLFILFSPLEQSKRQFSLWGRPCQEWQLPPSKLGRRKKPQLTRGGTHDRVNHRRLCKLLEDYVYMFNILQYKFHVCVCQCACVRMICMQPQPICFC